jgi:chemotaxis family two-component system response regulator Rcp1
VSNKRSIVLVEDSRADIFLVRQALTQSGLEHELFVLEDGSRAISFLSRIGQDMPCPDLVLMDLNLPKVDGTELIKLFKEHPGCKSVPVIVVTSSDSPRDRARTAELGISEYFCKPSDLTEFMRLGAMVRAVLEKDIRR